MKMEFTWEELLAYLKRNSYEVEHEFLDPSDRSEAMDEMVKVVKMSTVLSLFNGVALGDIKIEPINTWR